MLDSLLSHPQMPCQSSTVSLVFVNGAPGAFITKTKSKQSQGPEATLVKVLHSCLISKYR